MPTAAAITYDPSVRLDPIYGAGEEMEINVKLADGTYAKGTVLGEVTATPGTYKAYANGNSDGSELAKGLLRYGCTVASGVITIANEQGVTQVAAPMFTRGIFKTTDLTGLDAAGLADLSGNLVSGTIADGIIQFG